MRTHDIDLYKDITNLIVMNKEHISRARCSC